MAIGSFGKIVFDVSAAKVLTPRTISRTAGGNWASHDLLSGKPRKQFIGATLQTVSLEIVIRADLGYQPLQILNKLRKMTEAGTAEKLIIGGSPLTKLPLVITSMSDTWDTVYHHGELFQATVSLELEEYR